VINALLVALTGTSLRRSLVLSFACCATLAAGETNDSAGEAAAAEPTLQRFLARPDEPITKYRARRTLEGHNERFNMHATLEVQTELAGPGQFTYSIVNERGSDYIRGKLRQLLETEAEVIRTGDSSRSALTADNYQLTAGELAEPGIVKLLAKPRRKDVSLIDGAVFVTSDDADLLRVEGRLAKNPSFWTSKVYLVRRYDRIAGARVPVRLDSTAHIKLAGESRLTMTYEYEAVNGIPVK
jgi:hypothetical protein